MRAVEAVLWLVGGFSVILGRTIVAFIVLPAFVSVYLFFFIRDGAVLIGRADQRP